MTMRPDYGLYLVKKGVSRQVEHFFYDFRMDHVSLVGRAQYSTMVNIVREEQEFAMSLDFDQVSLPSILSMLPREAGERLGSEFRRDQTTARTIEFGGQVTMGIKARLGKLQKAEQEEFVPFILEEVFAGSEERSGVNETGWIYGPAKIEKVDAEAEGPVDNKGVSIDKLSEAIQPLNHLAYIMECAALDYTGELKRTLSALCDDVRKSRPGYTAFVVRSSLKDLEEALEAYTARNSALGASKLSSISRRWWQGLVYPPSHS